MHGPGVSGKMERHLTLGLIHLNVRYREPEINRRRLLELNEEAASSGAQVIVNTELALSGYSFDSREDIEPFLETVRGETLSKLTRIARRHKVFIVFGFAEKSEKTNIYSNSAVVLAPSGRVVRRYRKINAEPRWACPGPPQQDNTFDTPWGRVGVLICSDTYHGLIPRATALRGADLLLVPANWPSDGLDPRRLWRARSVENGIYLAACNRTGQDRRMDCSDAWSFVVGPDGISLMEGRSPDSKVFYCRIPLEDGKLPGAHRIERLKTRRPHLYGSLYLDLRFAHDPLTYFGLPDVDRIPVLCVSGHGDPLTLLEETLASSKEKPLAVVLPEFPADETDRDPGTAPAAWARKHRVHIAFSVFRGETSYLGLACPDGKVAWVDRENTKEVWTKDCEWGRIGVCGAEDLMHPEYAVACAKRGCDVLLVPARSLDSAKCIVLPARAVEQVAVAASARDGAFISEPPEGHSPWRETNVEGAGQCRMGLLTRRTRDKRLQDRVDYDLLLKDSALPTPGESRVRKCVEGSDLAFRSSDHDRNRQSRHNEP